MTEVKEGQIPALFDGIEASCPGSGAQWKSGRGVFVIVRAWRCDFEQDVAVALWRLRLPAGERRH